MSVDVVCAFVCFVSNRIVMGREVQRCAYIDDDQRSRRPCCHCSGTTRM